MKHFYNESTIGIIIDITTLGLLLSLVIVLNTIFLKVL
ncbi:hypothetical protein UFOVP1655_74 [uncultured Caudovirales phage]|jgi:hypothetical protein|uniref:Uncharacterized protein n=1 Tax=uncultured Caudovirales phage TaxID=2100421 RepID=A0A6J5T3J1_9CAUD|nr:hypothetical protein UFOVP1655_74 [uncultured Caudovirales phage]